MTDIRKKFEYGLLVIVESLGRDLALDEEFQVRRSDEDGFETIAGYIAAGMYADIISREEYTVLMKEVRRWQFA